jgi:hypothetical protein
MRIRPCKFATKALIDDGDVISLFCQAKEGHGIINERDLEASEPMSQKDKLYEVKAEALLAKAEAVASKKLYLVSDDSSESNMADSENKKDNKKDNKKEDAIGVQKVLKRTAEQLKETSQPTERPAKRQRTAPHKLEDYWGVKK